MMAQAQISNYTSPHTPILRSQIFKIPYEAPESQVRKALLQALHGVSGIRLDATPVVFASEAHESWVSYKLIYAIDDYGAQFSITDQVLANAVKELKKSGFMIAPPRILVQKEHA
jgi:small-conductance mechanosensitive channel